MQIVEPLLGTRAELSVAAESQEVAATCEADVIAEAERLESVFTVFDDDSALHHYRLTGSTDVPELRTVIDLALAWQTRTDGVFHPATQPLVDLWDQAEAADIEPSSAELAAAVEAIRSPSGGAASGASGSLSLNAIAKGWIAERALTLALTEEPMASGGWLSLGGDVVHRGAGSLTVDIEDPNRPYDNVAPLMTVQLSNEALATSGGARRWWRIAGRRYSKVLDPRTGRPVDRVAGATVIAPEGATADVLATVAIVATEEETLRLVEEAGAACLLIGRDGSVVTSSDRFRPWSTR